MDDRDLTYFLVFNLKIIHRAIEVFESYVEKKQSEILHTVTALRGYPGLSHRQYELLQYAISHPETRYTFRSFQTTYNVVYQTARTDLLALVKKGFLVKRKEGKEFYFYPPDTLAEKLRE